MRLCSFTTNAGASWGAVIKEAMIVDLGVRLPTYPTLRAALEAGALDVVRDIVEQCKDGDHSIDTVSFDPVIPDPRQVLCIGLNYESHQIETRREQSGHPTVFARYAQSQVGHRRPMILPPESACLDYEGELAIVIGKTCRRVPVEDAAAVIAGYACYNDGSIRDFQRHTSQFHPGKNWPATGAFGPWLVTSDEVPDPSILTIETRLNGSVVQSAGLDQLIFTLPELIAYCSTFTELRPGDVIVTGTPGGVGMARTPPLWMKPGDVVEVEVSGIGILVNTVESEHSPTTPFAQ